MATLNGTILNIDGNAPNGWRDSRRACPQAGPVTVSKAGSLEQHFADKAKIYFRPCATPFLDNGDSGDFICTSETHALVDDQTGEFTASLLAGNYRCCLGADEFEISIPSDEGTFELSAVIVCGVNNLPPASNANQGTFASGAADFVLPANAVGAPGNPVATAWIQTVYGPGKFQISAVVSILATSRNGGGAQDNDIFTAYIYDTTDAVMIGQQVTVENIFTGAQGQLLLTGTINIVGATNVLLEIYAAGNPTPADQTAAPDSVGTIKMAQSSISIARLP